MKQVRKVPMRKCVGCQEMRSKRELIRIVHTPEGDLQIDPTGKKNGRGAYLCRELSCFHSAQKRRSLERALKMSIPAELYATLQQQLEEAANGR